jgi:hypothetical protein
MSIDGRITVDALIHDRSGDERLKVLSLASSKGVTTGAAAFLTGTAGTAGTFLTYASYRDAAGNIIEIPDPYALAFSWSGSVVRALNDSGGSKFRLASRNNEVSVCSMDGSQPILHLLPNAIGGTGTYSIIIWGE